MSDVSTEKMGVSGQVVLPGMVEAVGYGSATPGLTPFQERFCWAYVLHAENGTAAYKSLKPSASDNTAAAAASRLLRNSKIAVRVEEIKVLELKRRYLVEVDELILYHGKVMKMDRRQFLNADRSPKSIHDLSEEALSIVDLETHVDGKGNVRMVPKVPEKGKGADALARIFGVDKSNVNVTGEQKITHDGAVAVVDDLAKLAALRSRFGMTSGAQHGERPADTAS